MNDLEQYRQEIDAIDGELGKLFLRRMEVTGKGGEWKQKNGVPVRDAARERHAPPPSGAGRGED